MYLYLWVDFEPRRKVQFLQRCGHKSIGGGGGRGGGGEGLRVGTPLIFVSYTPGAHSCSQKTVGKI